MERKQDCQEDEMVRNSNITINGDYHHHHHHHHHHDYDVSEKEDDDQGLDILKREVSCHSLYGLLVESHLDCLKLCLGKMENIEHVINPSALPNQYPNFYTADHSELDQFMEAYCMTLNKLKEVIEEPQQESMAFINLMYSQLEELLLDTSSGGRES